MGFFGLLPLNKRFTAPLSSSPHVHSLVRCERGFSALVTSICFAAVVAGDTVVKGVTVGEWGKEQAEPIFASVRSRMSKETMSFPKLLGPADAPVKEEGCFTWPSFFFYFFCSIL